MIRRASNPNELLPRAAPAHSYAEALERVDALQARDGPAVQPACFTQLLTHGVLVERALVLLHGYTNCPNEVARLGAVLHERGANVLIPRLPYHGLRDRMTTDVRLLSLGEQVALADEAIALACGLGARVVVAGLCSGGVLAAWAAQFHAGVARAVIIAPALMAATIPASLASPVMLLLDRLPNRFWWWNRRLKGRLAQPCYAYPRFSTHALGEIFRLGGEVLRAARCDAPAVHEIAVIANDADHVISRAAIAQLVAAWRAHGTPVESVAFAARHQLPHDLIDPGHPRARVELVYPVLIAQIERQPATPAVASLIQG